MKLLSKTNYQSFLQGARVLEQDSHGPKVLLTPEGTIYKLFRRKRRVWSSALWCPYAQRFVDNANQLRKRGIASVTIEHLYYCSEAKRYLVSYRLLPGQSIRDVCKADPNSIKWIPDLARFIASLHSKGVYFRSLHLGNILAREAYPLALIDIADMRFRSKALPSWQRARNFMHLLRYPEDYRTLAHFGITAFLQCYLDSAHLSPLSAWLFNKVLQHKLARIRP